MKRGRDIQSRPIRWLVPNRIPEGMITLVAGRPGVGKSLFTAWLTNEVTRQGHSVILSNQEDAVREVLKPRLEATGVDMKRVYLPEEPIMLPAQIDLLEKKIKETRAKLVILDAAAQHLNVSIFNNQETRKALTPLRAVLERTGCACVMVTHTKKQSNGHPLESIGGSSGGLVGAARLVYIFGPDPKDPDARILAPAKSNLGPIDKGSEFAVEVIGHIVNTQRGGTLTHKIARLKLVSQHSKVTAAAVVSFAGSRKAAGDDPTDVTRLAMAEEWLTGLLKDGPMKAADIEEEAKKVKLSWATTLRACKSLEVAKKRHGFGANGHWTWDLPDGHPLKKEPDAPDGDGMAVNVDAVNVDALIDDLLAEQTDDDKGKRPAKGGKS